jgi:hypothetical protein
MSKFAIRLLTLAMYMTALVAVPLVTPAKAAGGGGGGPSPPAEGSKEVKKTKKKSGKVSFIDDPSFIEGYRTAYATIYDRNDYASAIEQLKALGHDDRADVANLIGYSYRKLGATRSRKSGTSARSRPTPATCGPGSIMACGSSNKATAIRRNIT